MKLEDPFRCRICNKIFNQRSLKIHVEKNHNLNYKDYIRKIHFGYELRCKNCGVYLPDNKIGLSECRDFCSIKCFRNYFDNHKDEFLEKTQVTNMKKYGVKNQQNADCIKEKIKQTNLNRYGVENVFQDKNVKNKCKETKLEKHNDENYNNSQQMITTKRELYGEKMEKIVENCVKTNLKKYGCEYYFQTEDYKEKSKQAYLNKYGVEKHQQKNFINLNDLNENFVKEEFIKNNRFLIDDFMDYFNILSPITAKSYKEKFNINDLNKSNRCKTQQFIFDSINIENKIYNSHHLGKELDIYLPDYKLAIEYDGLLYHSEGIEDYSKFRSTNKNYHLNKTELCESNGIQLFHIFEGEDLGLWLSMINSKLGLNNKIFARKCIIKELNSKDCIYFLNKNHLQGFCQAKINVGLFYEDELVSVMTFSKPRFNKKYEYELIRFASKRNYTIVGSASKLWNYFVNKYNPNSVITYANRRFSNGDLYYKLGFSFIEKTQPNYFYFNRREFKLYSRVKFQKHKLKDILEVYDENLSETENMFNNDYRRIYDCGNLKFEWIRDKYNKKD